jgi:hypothetical protein
MKINVQRVISRQEYRLATGGVSDQLELAPDGFVDSLALLEGHGWTLHGFDYDRGGASFLEIEQRADLFRTPFCYKTQFRLAKRHALVPFADFVKLAGGIVPSSRFVHFFNIGHCGSTLVHHVINASGAAWDLSEPRFCFDLAWHRDRLPHAEQVKLARAGLAFLSRFPLAQERETIFVKHFSQDTKSYSVWRDASPESQSIYMYRDAVSWCNSVFGFAQRMGMTVPMSREMRFFGWKIQSAGESERFLDGLLDLESEDVQFEQIATCAWSLHQQEFLAARKAGMKLHAFRYNELMEDRIGVLKRLFSYCGLNPDNTESGLSAFDQDAHEGEESSHNKPVLKLDDAARMRILALLKHPRLNFDSNLRF